MKRQVDCNSEVITNAVKGILDKHGIAGSMRLTYRDFAEQVCSTCNKLGWGSQEAASEVGRLMEEYQSRYDADEAILKEIVAKAFQACLGGLAQ